MIFAPDYSEVVDRKETIKGLGSLVDEGLDYKDQMQRALSKTRQKVGWITRTFRNREVKFLRTLWNSLAQPHMDYGSIPWAPRVIKLNY